MALLIYAIFLFFWFLIVVLFYIWTALFWSMIFRVQKFENEGKRTKAGFSTIVSIALTIFLLKLICHFTDTPSLFQFTKITSTCFIAAFIYFVVLGIATIPFIKKDGADLLKQALYRNKKKEIRKKLSNWF
ncbi:hypothetical protein [Heyndrickxia oleronia]|jgi:hypothetical protein|uniref:hypothetical protein n=1 Tax=Heyndrickxia oleronia TaxID=38875 RepID=UPI000716F40B|nr:hypothetical protein [Heyndrickxia oleronia]NYV68360.1 hypothetical protein [Bacillus sp. Gen3]